MKIILYLMAVFAGTVSGVAQERDREPEREREHAKSEDKADRGDERLPEVLVGFSGQVGAIVEGKADGPALVVRVLKVHKVWKDNKAGDPEALQGRRIRVGPGWAKSDAGKWNKIPLHVNFINAFPVKEDCRLEIKNLEGHGFSILELDERQREFAKRNMSERTEGERGRERPKERERERDSGRAHDRERESDREEASAEARLRRLERELERLRAELREIRGRERD